jgi:hypothetical protein
VVAVGEPGAGSDLDPTIADLDPAVGCAALAVPRLVGGYPRPALRVVVGFEVRGRDALPGDVESQRRLVRLEDKSDIAERGQELVPQRPGADRVVLSPEPTCAYRRLHAAEVEAGIAGYDFGVRSYPEARINERAVLSAIHPKVVTVVPIEVVRRHLAERVGVLMNRKFVIGSEHLQPLA